jgi:hypothetical protein
LIEKGLEVDCKHASACKEADKDMILMQIGDNVAELNSTIHGVVAGCYARQYLQKEQGAWKRYLDKISRGKLKKFQLDLSDFTGDKLHTIRDRLCELLKHLDSESLKQLRLSGVSIGCDYWGNCLSQFRALRILILSQNPGLSSLPEEIGDLSELKILNVEDCDTLVKLPDSICKLSKLETLNVGFCDELCSLLEDIQKLTSLKKLVLCMCPKLKRLPDSMGDLTGLKVLDLRLCPAASHPGTEPLKKKLRDNGCTIMALDEDSWKIESAVPREFGVATMDSRVIEMECDAAAREPASPTRSPRYSLLRTHHPQTEVALQVDGVVGV